MSDPRPDSRKHHHRSDAPDRVETAVVTVSLRTAVVPSLTAVMMMHSVSGLAPRMWASSSRPLMPGMVMSINARS